MKNTLATIAACMIMIMLNGQSKINPNQGGQTDRAEFEKNQKTAIEKVNNEVTKKLKDYHNKKQASDAQINTGLSANISLYIENTLRYRPLDKNLIPNDKPVISEVYYPNKQGVKPLGDFLLIGANLLSLKSGALEVTVKVGQSILKCVPDYSNSTDGWLWLRMADFSGIAAASQTTLTVKSNGLLSDPVSVTILPELVTQKLDLSLLLNQLKTDYRSTSDMLFAGNMAELSVKHGFIVFYSTTLGIYHNHAYAQSVNYLNGTDELFLTTRLKNNWVLKEVVGIDNRSVCGTVPDGQTSANFGSYNLGTSSLYVKVSWYTNQAMCFKASGFVSFIVEGPKGTSYW